VVSRPFFHAESIGVAGGPRNSKPTDVVFKRQIAQRFLGNKRVRNGGNDVQTRDKLKANE
jgi:hypothetical protein